jgi:hypothetical protein
MKIWSRHVANMGERNTYRDLVRKPDGKRRLGWRENCLVKCLIVKIWVKGYGVDSFG